MAKGASKEAPNNERLKKHAGRRNAEIIVHCLDESLSPALLVILLFLKFLSTSMSTVPFLSFLPFCELFSFYTSIQYCCSFIRLAIPPRAPPRRLAAITRTTYIETARFEIVSNIARARMNITRKLNNIWN